MNIRVLSWYLFVNCKTQIDASVVIFALSTFHDASYSKNACFLSEAERLSESATYLLACREEKLK